MKGTRLDAVSSIQQTVTREQKAIQKEAFSRAFFSLYERCKRRAEQGEGYTILSDGINKSFLSFCAVCMSLVSEIVTLRISIEALRVLKGDEKGTRHLGGITGPPCHWWT
jgi:hypothetical protein